MVFFSLLKILCDKKIELRPLYPLNLSHATHLHDGSLNNFTHMKNILVNNKKEIEYQVGYENYHSDGQLRGKEFEDNNFEVHINFSIKNIIRKGTGITFFIGNLQENSEGDKFYEIGGFYTGLIVIFDLQKNSLKYNFFDGIQLSESLNFKSQNLTNKVYEHPIELKIVSEFNKQRILIKDLSGEYVEIGSMNEKMPRSKQLIVSTKNLGDGISTYVIRSINFYEQIKISMHNEKSDGFSYYHILILGIIVAGLCYILYVKKNK